MKGWAVCFIAVGCASCAEPGASQSAPSEGAAQSSRSAAADRASTGETASVPSDAPERASGEQQGAISDPAASDPAASDPAASDPAASDPAASDPAASDGEPSAPDAAAPGAGHPAAAESPPATLPIADTEGESGSPSSAAVSGAPAAPPPAPTSPAAAPAAPEITLPADAPRVTVSFTFDDTYEPQVQAASILEAHALRGTFYVNSPRLHRATERPDEGEYMSIADALELQAAGHEIGGHTLGHLSLTDLPEVERIREIMTDRMELVRLGFTAGSFAYPFGHVEDDPDRSLGRPVLEITRESGYASARDTNGFALGSCNGGPETLPPADPFLLRSIHSVSEPPEDAAGPVPPDTASVLLGWLDHTAACGGGWLPLIFHHLRDDCSGPDAPDGYCFEFGELDRLAAELAQGARCPDEEGAACYRIEVVRVGDAIGVTEVAPAPEVPGVRNPSLERTLDSGDTECIRTTGASTAAVFSRSTLAHSGQASERLEVSAPFTATAEIGLERDDGECAPFVLEGNTYDLSMYYRADPSGATPSLRFATYRLTSDYEWVPWETGVAVPAEAPGTWVQRSFTTAPVPAGTIALSFGLRQESPGAINVDDFDVEPLGPASGPAADP